MKIGLLNQKIQFVTVGQVSDGAGGTVNQETIALTTFAFIEQLKRSRDLEQAQQMLKGVFRVVIYDRLGFAVNESMIVKWNSKKYSIISAPEIDDVRNRRFVTFDISEVK